MFLVKCIIVSKYERNINSYTNSLIRFKDRFIGLFNILNNLIQFDFHFYNLYFQTNNNLLNYFMF